jgi:hypothetical protein
MSLQTTTTFSFKIFDIKKGSDTSLTFIPFFLKHVSAQNCNDIQSVFYHLYNF